MRTGGYTLQQTLTADATRVVNQAVTLARCRGHAHVTPLHVANTMLSASAGLFRTACLQSHSHPLQCKALELCFNVALNRLPASASASPMLGTNSQHPSISNALVAAFKRAQAHQRRGSIENQQQPLLAVKIELEQLIISILDDPSVSRVMREAGFCSTQVKSNVEQAVSLEICSQSTPSLSSKSKESNQLALLQSEVPVGQSGTKIDLIQNEEVRSVIDHLMNTRSRKSTVIVGECLDNLENTVRGVMNKVDKGDVPEALRKVNFIQVTLSSFGHRSRVDVEQKLGELKSVVNSCLNQGVVLYLGDLNWVTDYRASSTEHEIRGRYYCPVEHMIMELGKLISGIGEPESFWLMGIATFQTYMKCKSSGTHPSLEAVWGLHPLTIPAASLRLSLITADSTDRQSQSTNKKAENGNSSLLLEGGHDMEAQSLQSSTCNSVSTTSSQLPAWLRQYKNESKGFICNDQNYVPVRDHLCKKWNSICTSIHKQPHSSEKTRTFSSLSPSSSTSCFSHDHPYPNLHQIIHHEWPAAEPKKSWRHHDRIWISEDSNVTVEPRLTMGIPDQNVDSKRPFSSNPNSTHNSPSSSEIMMETECSHRFKEFSAENMKTLCNALEKKVPWQKDIIPEIANTILKCRSGMARRKGMARNNEFKEETWLFFQGADTEAKEKIARELAKLIFGSQRCFISIAMSTFSSTRADSTEDCKNKRLREEQSCSSYIERFAEAVSTNPHMVFLVEDVEQADYLSQMGFKRAIERGRIANCDGEEVDLSDAIIILSCESFSSRSRACSPPSKQKSEGSEDHQKGSAMEETSPCVSLDLNISIDDDCAADPSIDEIGLLETVDKRFYFKIQEL